MSASWVAVSWNRQKRLYDLVLWGGILLYLATFIGITATLHPDATAETLLIRGLGTAAFLLLTITLCIGPAARLDPRLLPLLYNRRHLGVSTFLIALGHGIFSLIQFHTLGDLSPLVSLFASNPLYLSVSEFPFQILGFAALLILFFMAATSHDFWLAHLTPPAWKTLHMLVYVAWALLVLHIALGALQSERNPILVVVLAGSVAAVLGLHLAAARRESAIDQAAARPAVEDGFVDVGDAAKIPDKRALVVSLAGERIAIFRNGDRISAISNVCRHQNGPLGEGRILDDCVTCPWHGYQYDAETGASPPPFTEKVPTFAVRVEAGRVLVHPQPHPPGTRQEPARLPTDEARR